jgi:hypothetical protein
MIALYRARGDRPTNSSSVRRRRRTVGAGVKAILQTCIAEPAFYHDRKQIAGKGEAEIRRPKPIEKESTRLKKLRAALTEMSFPLSWSFHDVMEEGSGASEFIRPDPGRPIPGRGVASGWVNISMPLDRSG